MKYLTDAADRRIDCLRIKCNMGVYDDRLFKRIAKGPDSLYPLGKLEWMRGHVESGNRLIAAGCLECLCAHGAKIGEFRGSIAANASNFGWCRKAIEIAERQDDPDFLLEFLDEKSPCMNRAVIALKRKGHETYLTTLMLSDDDDLVRAIARIANAKNKIH